MRALVELDAIEILGRLTGTPYWACLGAHSDDPDVQRTRTDIFSNLSAPERVVFAQRRLTRLGLYHGPLNGQTSPDLLAAVTAYTRSIGAVPSAVESFTLYEALTRWSAQNSADLAPRPAPVPPAALAALPSTSLARPEAAPLQVQLVLANDTPRAGSGIALTLRTNKVAYAYCYLESRDGSVARVFPNRWQPDPTVWPQQPIMVPSAQAGFQIVPPSSGEEKIACFASSHELAPTLPESLRTQDLEPVPTPSLEALSRQFREETVRHAAEFSQGEQAIGAKH